MSRGKCVKRSWRSRGQAERALQFIRRYGDNGPDGHKPKRVYLCDGDDGNPNPCFRFHLSSREW